MEVNGNEVWSGTGPRRRFTLQERVRALPVFCVAKKHCNPPPDAKGVRMPEGCTSGQSSMTRVQCCWGWACGLEHGSGNATQRNTKAV